MLELRTLVLSLALCVVTASGRDEPRKRGDGRGAPTTTSTSLNVALVRCTPTSISVNGAAPIAAGNPIAQALSNAGPGSTIELAPGDYPAFAIGLDKQAPWNARISGGTALQPIVVRATGKVRIVPQSGGDTIAIAQQFACSNVVFEGLTIEAGYRAGIMFYKCGPNQLHDGFKFKDCEILGGFDHLTGQGRNSKWGVWGHSLKDFEFVGATRPAVITGLRNEHAFYLQNAKGDITIDNVQASRLGRTFIQITARPGDGEAGLGTITVRNCVVEDACIAIGDDHKGGSAFTVAGRHLGTLIFENNKYRAGFTPGIQRLTREGVPYGTGAFVAWDGRGASNGTLILRNNDFELAPGCGDRPLVSIGGCKDVQILGKNRFVAGRASALELDPVLPGFASNPNGKVVLDKAAEIKGAVRSGGRDTSVAELQKQRETKPRKEPGGAVK